MKAFIIYSTYTNLEDQTLVQLFGRLENNQSFVTLNKFSPFLYIKKPDLKKISKYLKNYQISKSNLKNFQNEPVIKISAENSAELNKLYKQIHKIVQTYEADLKPHQQFLINSNILTSIEIEGDYESSEKIDRIYHEPKITPTKHNPNLKLAAIDIETSKHTNKLLCIGIYSGNYKKNFLINSENLKIPDTIICKNEEECLEKFKRALIELDPDVITGWNVIDFDLVYLKNLFQKNKILFDLGRSNNPCRLRIESHFLKSSSVDIPGRQIIDGLNAIKDPFVKPMLMKQTKFESLSLEDVSQAILKKGKTIKGKSRHTEIENLYQTNPKKLVEYNLLDCELAYEILKQTKIIELMIERSQLTGLTFERLSGSIAAFDSLYIRKAHSKGMVSPTTDYKPKEERIKGGYVSSLKSGIYKNVLVLDFKSLYPSIIRTFNIDPASFKEKCSPSDIKAPNNACFKNTKGILPEIIQTLHNAREKAKKENRALANYAIKTIQNSFFGVLANPNCRYFSLDMANAITHFGQVIIKLTAKEIEKKFKYSVIYSDTDSIFVETSLPKQKANSLGEEIQNYVNEFYKHYTKKNYNRESKLELEFEKQYLRLMIPKVRGFGEMMAAKKRYAGLVEKNGEEKLEIVGLEAIRGDWTEAAKEFQRELLKKLFYENPIAQFIKDYIKKIKEGKIDEKLVYRKSIRKTLEQYTKTTPPHVKAARLMPELSSNVIEYILTTAGPEPIAHQKHPIDYQHYIDKQIKPIANQILDLLGKDFDDITQKSRQMKLF